MSTTSQPAVRFRWAKPEEIGQVMEIDAATWPKPLSELAWHKALIVDGVTCAVATVGGRIVGYMAYKLFDDFIHLYKIAVRPEDQRRGIGGAMLGRLDLTLERSGRMHIQLNCRADNAAALRLYRRQGFTASHLEPDYYGPGEDACAMICEARS